MLGQLVVVAGPDKGKVFSVQNGQTLTLGRGQASDSRIEDPHMSRVHCQVQAVEEKVWLIDNNSTGGTLFKNEKIQKVELPHNGIFQIGDTQVQFLSAKAQEHATLKVGSFQNPPAPSGSSAPLKSLLGTMVSRYRLDAVIAEGTSGTVFKGFDTEKNRIVAVKILTPDPYQTEEQMERFVRAMQTMLPIRHPNIVRLYYAGKVGPYCWSAMEFVDGENLADVIKRIGIRGMLDWREAFRVAVDICRALEASNEQKIIHRNLTPNNILRRHSDKVSLMGDLMLAKATEGKLAKQVTQPGKIVGDLAYLSPERTRDDANIDHRSDLYGLGATLYALLTGKAPFEHPSLPVLIKMIRDDAPVQPKDFQLSIEDRFQDTVLQLLKKRPEDRYQTPDALMRDLERIAKFNNLPMD